jgi:FlaA1/EpsC-like NDP-sugar epimerase
MGTPVRIVDMARTLIRLSGTPEESVQIQFTGLREGEKLEEELFYRHEEVLPTTCDKIKRINGSKPDNRRLCSQLEELRTSLSIDGTGPIRAKIREIVPEYYYEVEPACLVTPEGLGENRTRIATAND